MPSGCSRLIGWGGFCDESSTASIVNHVMSCLIRNFLTTRIFLNLVTFAARIRYLTLWSWSHAFMDIFRSVSAGKLPLSLPTDVLSFSGRSSHASSISSCSAFIPGHFVHKGIEGIPPKHEYWSCSSNQSPFATFSSQVWGFVLENLIRYRQRIIAASRRMCI